MNGLRMRVGRIAASLLVATTALATVATTSGAGVPPISINPTSLHAGETITVNGNCVGDSVEYGLYAGTITGNVAPSGTPLVSGTFTMVSSIWSGTLLVPLATPPGEYTVNAECIGDGSIFWNASVTVLPDAATTTAAPTTVAPTTTAPQPPAAAPAVVAQPTYTG